MAHDEAVLLDIIRAAELILAFTAEMDEASFIADIKTQSAVLHQLMVMGEAVKRLSSDFRSRYQQIPWALIAGMRDKLIHGYDIVDLGEVWKTVSSDIPVLLTELRPLMSR